MTDYKGPMERIHEGLMSEDSMETSDLKEEVRSLGIDPDAALLKLKSHLNHLLKEHRMAWRVAAIERKAGFESKQKMRTSWSLRSPEEINSAFTRLVEERSLALAFRNRKEGELSPEDKAQILDSFDAIERSE